MRIKCNETINVAVICDEIKKKKIFIKIKLLITVLYGIYVIVIFGYNRQICF